MLEKIIKTISQIVLFISAYPFWVKMIFSVWFIMTAVLILAFILAKPQSKVPDTSETVGENKKQQESTKRSLDTVDQQIRQSDRSKNIDIGKLSGGSVIQAETIDEVKIEERYYQEVREETEPLKPPIREIALPKSSHSSGKRMVHSQLAIPIKLVRILEGQADDLSSRVFELILQNASDSQTMLMKYKIFWQYIGGTATALVQGVALKPVAKYIIELPIDKFDESPQERTDILYPIVLIPARNESGPSITTLRFQTHYYFTGESKEHRGSDWDIIFDLYLYDENDRELMVFHQQSWNFRNEGEEKQENNP